MTDPDVFFSHDQATIYALRQENERLRAALSRMLLEFDFMIEANMIADVRNDIIFVQARTALQGDAL